MKSLFLATLIACSSANAFPQSSPASTKYADGLTLLQRVSQHYADAKSYYIQSASQLHTIGAYDETTIKTLITVAEAPVGRSYFEAHTNSGSAIKVSDGKTIWTYHLDEHRYTVAPLQTVSAHAITPYAEMGLMTATILRRELAGTAKYFKSAQRLPDQTIKPNGRKIACYVVHVTTSDRKRLSSGDFDRTIWIDKQNLTFLKVSEHGHRYMSTGASRLPMVEDQTTIYTETRLDQHITDSLFTFIPPADAQLVGKFSINGAADLSGGQIPPLKFKSADGKVVTIESFRGQPVLLDFWATWCAPCIASMPKLAAIHQEAKGNGLVLLSVDQDEDAAKATDFFAKKNYTWPEFHDGDGSIERLMGSAPIPRTVLVDATGQVVDDEMGIDENRLRTAIASLGPQYASLAPKPPASKPNDASALNSK
jgi:thiol-disulfide isomerase/thioredoxin